LTEDDRGAVERAVNGCRRPDGDDVRRIDSALEVRADQLDAVTWGHLVVGGVRAVPVRDEPEQVLRRVPAGEGARRARAVAADRSVLHEHATRGVDRRLPLVADDAADVDFGAAVDEDRAEDGQGLVRVVPRELTADGLAHVRAPRRETTRTRP